MKQKIVFYALLLAMIVAVLFPTVSAYMVKQTKKIQNVIEPGQVICKVNEDYDGTKKTSVTVTNTSNIEAYIRVRIVSYWQDSKGNTVAKTSEMPAFSVSNDWIADVNNHTYYCKKPIAVGAETPQLLENGSSITLKKDTLTHNEVVYEYNQVVEIIAEAIQSKPESVVETYWKVTVTDGEITSVN